MITGGAVVVESDDGLVGAAGVGVGATVGKMAVMTAVEAVAGGTVEVIVEEAFVGEVVSVTLGGRVVLPAIVGGLLLLLLVGNNDGVAVKVGTTGVGSEVGTAVGAMIIVIVGSMVGEMMVVL